MAKPLDHPTPERPHRIYFALTNHCNRACPWCSTCSSPHGGTWLSVADYVSSFPQEGPFEVQLEGGEPTIHPHFIEFVSRARSHPRCMNLVVCTNGVVLPRSVEKLRTWVIELGTPLTIKLSVNHHLIERDARHIDVAVMLRDVIDSLAGDRLLVINVRLRRGVADDDHQVRAAIAAAGLERHANIFFLQRYGFATAEEGWDKPVPVMSNFTLINPDGKRYGPDLVARSEGMRVLP
jgi:hypothetical protein